MFKLITFILLLLSISACTSLREMFQDKPDGATEQKYVVDSEVRSGKVMDTADIRAQEITLADREEPLDFSQQTPRQEVADGRSMWQQNVDAIIGNNGEPIIFYFDFDSINLSQQSIAGLIIYAKKMRQNPQLKLRLEGHADERGSRNYNLALGESRALAIRDVLALYSVEERIEVVSYGEEKPQDERHNEIAWQENRRVELIFY